MDAFSYGCGIVTVYGVGLAASIYSFWRDGDRPRKRKTKVDPPDANHTYLSRNVEDAAGVDRAVLGVQLAYWRNQWGVMSQPQRLYMAARLAGHDHDFAAAQAMLNAHVHIEDFVKRGEPTSSPGVNEPIGSLSTDAADTAPSRVTGDEAPDERNTRWPKDPRQ